ncbi:hypothetical protein [Natrinema salsiterrestre]|uniref:Uncharacterized protein n=1 Tax=Natrinema salsiterrestre TaxID=2950540 RepID=A0A9Q4L634_9EURY|nr:hypothetical protein [Natrinema salsiterrestre]MDF9748297.1 hypothetical protein [Natrinema salsiterrestre]
MARRPGFGMSSIDWSPVKADEITQETHATRVSNTEQVEAVLTNIIEDATAATDIAGYIRSVDVEADDEKLVAVTLHFQEVDQ